MEHSSATALIELFESGKFSGGLLRTWEPPNYFVVLGYSNRIDAETNAAACARRRVPILRRFSGGGAVLQGPGCLNYSLILRNSAAGTITDSFRLVLERHRGFLERSMKTEIRIEGISDLAVDGRKISGNAQHRKRQYILLHGTFLLNLDFSLLEECLYLPLKQPPYRTNRPHRDFLKNIELGSNEVRQGLRRVWNAHDVFSEVPYARIAELVTDRYLRSDWTQRF